MQLRLFPAILAIFNGWEMLLLTFMSLLGLGLFWYLLEREEAGALSAPTRTAAASVEDQLTEVQKLKEKGLITEEEATQKKRQILKL